MKVELHLIKLVEVRIVKDAIIHCVNQFDVEYGSTRINLKLSLFSSVYGVCLVYIYSQDKLRADKSFPQIIFSNIKV